MRNILKKQHSLLLFCVGCLLAFTEHASGQTPLLLSQAVKDGLQHYQSIEAKKNYLKASQALVKNTQNEYLPNVIAGIQQDFGTVNGQYGPLTAFSASGVASSGPVYSGQTWNAGFGATYLLNTNWEVFSFGRLQSKIKFYESGAKKDSADLVQEEFIQSLRISGAYLNLLVAQRLVDNAQANLSRAQRLQAVVQARTINGLNAGVDSSIANAEVSSARLSLISARDNEQVVNNQLAQLLNADPSNRFMLDTSFFKAIPIQLQTQMDVSQNPQVKYYQSRINESNQATDYLKKSILPGFNLFGVYQSRASGFDYDYSPSTPGSYSKAYIDGINPTRSNYAAGFAIAWNILSIKKIKEQARSQDYITKAYQNEYDLINTQLKDQLALSDQRIANSLQSYHEVPVQYEAAADAYTQKSVLYKNGLTNIVDLQQALYALNKAETDMSVSYISVWQALLLKAAASGDLNLFMSQVK